MNTPLLSVCIPTFNRQSDLRDCLESLKHHWIPGVEIVVSDNASTDNTIAMLEDYAKELPLRWQRQSTNLGFDRNCAAVVAMAHGKYCWILGSDDCITPDSLQEAVSQLRRHNPDIFHFGYVQGDISLQPLLRVAPVSSFRPVAMNSVEAAKYIGFLPSLSLAFLFISCFIFRREHWMSQIDRLQLWIGSNYVHAYMLHAMIAMDVSVLSTDECLVIARGGNPNDWNASPGKLLWLDAVTLVRIHREINSDARYLEALGRVFRRSYSNKTIVIVAAFGGLSNLLACRSELTALGHSDRLIRLLQLVDQLHLMPGLAGVANLRRYFLNSFGRIRNHYSK
jgi:abequosyltransferase